MPASRLSAYRNRQDLIDPTKQAAGVLEISNKLVSEQAALQAQLELMQRVAPRNPAIPALRSRIARSVARSQRKMAVP